MEFIITPDDYATNEDLARALEGAFVYQVDAELDAMRKAYISGGVPALAKYTGKDYATGWVVRNGELVMLTMCVDFNTKANHIVSYASDTVARAMLTEETAAFKFITEAHIKDGLSTEAAKAEARAIIAAEPWTYKKHYGYAVARATISKVLPEMLKAIGR